MHAFRLLCVLLAVLTLSCDSGRDVSAQAPAAQASAPPAPPALRLPRTVVPEANQVWLVLDPAKSEFGGQIAIRARVAEPTRVLWLNAEKLAVARASAAVGSETWPLEVLPQSENFVGLRAPRELPVGPVRVEIEYTGAVDDTETLGIFRQRESEDWYAFTQFESLGARRAFPCFDEPDRKATWQLTLEVPEALLAVSNTQVASERKTERGTKLVEFRETKPLSSYLVAFAVGPFERVSAGTTRSGAPIGVVVTKGRGKDVGYVVENAGTILGILEDYFGMPYPFEKLDLLGLPTTVGFSAMENVGLVTFRQSLLAARPQELGMRYRRSFASVAAHELAHMWFGDLVTMAWWDDVWLNEAFATWMAERVIAQWKPEWEHGTGSATRRSRAIGMDGFESARKIRQPIESNDDIENAFDGITYQKGAAIIRMFETRIGAEEFQAGVRSYLKQHAYGNATSDDFLRAIGQAAELDIAPQFSSFLERVGAPLVSFELACTPEQKPRLVLQQSRYLPYGSRADAKQQWQLPLCVKYPVGEQVVAECALLSEPKQEIELKNAGTSCPAWLQPNQDGTGYYRSQLQGDLLARLLERGLPQLTLAERLALVSDIDALTEAGVLDIGQSLGLVPLLAGEREREVVAQVAGLAAGVRGSVPEELRPNYARFIRGAFGARARALGWQPAAGEDDDTRMLRSNLVGLVSVLGQDRELAGGATALTLTWLEHPEAVDPDLVGTALDTAGRFGDRALFDRFVAAAKQARDRRDRERLLGALSSFGDPELVQRSIALVTNGEFDPRDADSVLFDDRPDPAADRVAYETIKRDYAALEAKLPKDTMASLVYTGTRLCDASLKADVESFYAERTKKLPGGPRTYAQAMEGLDLCIQQRAALLPGLTAFLQKY